MRAVPPFVQTFVFGGCSNPSLPSSYFPCLISPQPMTRTTTWSQNWQQNVSQNRRYMRNKSEKSANVSAPMCLTLTTLRNGSGIVYGLLPETLPLAGCEAKT
uniref:Uncharacterized protein n=1 Tax=Anopheles farauti TaxID=69004 RepID=A0A182QQG1_9DIPT